jgi:hypothetical protein
MLNKINNQSPLLTKKIDAEKGKNWNALARARENQQHKDPDNIPEGDIHAVRKIEGHAAPVVPEEKTKAALASLEEQIKMLQIKQRDEAQTHKQSQQPPKQELDDPFDWIDD